RDFPAREGSRPMGGLLSAGGFLYGTTCTGGAADLGTIFKMKEDGTAFTILHEFWGVDGSCPVADLIRDSAGVLYGTTAGGATGGVVFRINMDGSGYSMLHGFHWT